MASGSFQYPWKTLSPRTQISPASPDWHVVAVVADEAHLLARPAAGRPIRAGTSSPAELVTTGDASVRPYPSWIADAEPLAASARRPPVDSRAAPGRRQADRWRTRRRAARRSG